MIRPAAFGPNPQTAASNRFQRSLGAETETLVQEKAITEFQGLVETLEAEGVAVIVVDDLVQPRTPDAVFPNNWISFHADGTAVLYPMESELRRSEVRRDILVSLREDQGFVHHRIVDLSERAETEGFLEGTGSLVLDRVNAVAYASLSSRTHPALVEEFGSALGFDTLTFRAFDAHGNSVYHTNVTMAVGEDFAVVCLESITDSAERAALAGSLAERGREVVEISMAQMARFCGNLLEVRTSTGEVLAVMSDTARDAFSETQTARIAKHARIVSSPIPTIERFGGGSVRCMLAEIHLPRQ